MDREYLASRGVRVCLQGHQPFAAATKALHDTMKHLRDGGDPALLKPQLAGDQLTGISTRGDDYERWMREFPAESGGFAPGSAFLRCCRRWFRLHQVTAPGSCVP
ncbi:MAG: hypothetical protein R3E68_15975 [Burkholderiaceae bacterium]